MKKWKYLKGDKSDFVGAPEWATIKAKSRGRVYFAESHKPFGRFMFEDKMVIGVIPSEGVNEELNEMIAQRDIFDDDEQDINDCIGSTESLIAERGSRYGKFKDCADIMQSLKDVMREVDGWNDLTPSQKEALDMIQHKIGRILNGDPNYDDNWKDVAGYATLIVNELNGEAK